MTITRRAALAAAIATTSALLLEGDKPMARSDDLAPLFRGAPPSNVSFKNGVIVEWNPATFENVIRVGGTLMRDLPVLSGADALTYRPGDVVIIKSVGRGAVTLLIEGRVIMPGTDAGARAVDWMTASLARELAAAVFADRLHTSEIPGQGVRSSTAWGDLADKAGPVVTATIGESGKALVMLGGTITTGGGVYTGGLMGFQISNATGRLPTVPDSLEASMSAESFSQSASRTILVTDLNPGTNTFTAKYRSVASGVPFTCENRNLVVIAL